MSRLFLSILLAVLLLFCFSQANQNNSLLYNTADSLFLKAEHLAQIAENDENKQESANNMYNAALSAFERFIKSSPKAGNDSLLFVAMIKAGFAGSYLDSIMAAKKNYLTAISLKQKLPGIPDSLLFTPYLYTGGIYYLQNQFDSAMTFYKKAETINDLYKNPLSESQRLYNRLGVMFYETGNYRQARNYFEKAITLTNPEDTHLLANYKINIASLLVKLEEFEAAEAMYKNLLPFTVYQNEINHNLGIIALAQKNYYRAITYLLKVSYPDDPKSIDLYYHFGMAWSGLKNFDSSAFFIQAALKENQKWNGQRKNISTGLIFKFQADELIRQRAFKKAVLLYQQAIIEFDNTFNDTDITKNPSQFTAVFSYINLFNTLTAKAETFEHIYTQEKDSKNLEAGLNCYRAAFKLAEYVEKTYNSDESRLFLNKIKYNIHSKPINLCLQLYELTQDREYLQEAYFFDQRNKASILSINLQQNETRDKLAADNPLINKESSIKAAITRLLLKASVTSDSTILVQINNTIRDHEIGLEKIQEKINGDQAWVKRNLTKQIPSIDQLQKILDKKTAILSYHLSENEILIFFISASRFEFKKSPFTKSFLADIDSFKTTLQNTTAEYRYNSDTVSMKLYRALIAPFQPGLSTINRLIIIPDDELHYLPFEALQNENKKYLVEQYSVQYNYSTTLLGKDFSKGKKHTTLAFAPFAYRSYTDSSGYLLNSLPASKDEVSTLQGKVFMDTSATKNNFLVSANHYNIIHLATHASVNNRDPSGSFISFYPGTQDYKLFSQEIYNLHLDSTDLVVLSACETGTGQLIRGEGLMSLSRAFAYAGCPNIITSLWKAEDKATAFLVQRLYTHMGNGFTKDIALQRAKIDLLASTEIAPRFKTPAYWAHLLFIGNYQPQQNTWPGWWIAIAIVAVITAYYIIKRKARPFK
jgi:CHAT domain-containing protein